MAYRPDGPAELQRAAPTRLADPVLGQPAAPVNSLPGPGARQPELPWPTPRLTWPGLTAPDLIAAAPAPTATAVPATGSPVRALPQLPQRLAPKPAWHHLRA
jgi:hypothetical protein